jgi:hypothetical protein
VSGRRLTGFVDPGSGAWRELRDPDGPATLRQIAALYRAGALVLTDPGGGRFTKAEASRAIDYAIRVGFLERPRPRDPGERFDRVCRDLVAFVVAHPGCSTGAAVEGVYGAGAYVGDRVLDLLSLGVLVDRAARQGRGRELHVNDNAGETPTGRRPR